MSWHGRGGGGGGGGYDGGGFRHNTSYPPQEEEEQYHDGDGNNGGYDDNNEGGSYGGGGRGRGGGGHSRSYAAPRNSVGSENRKRMRHDVRFSDMTAEQKLKARREERQEKKEMSRTMGYFVSVKEVLEEQAQAIKTAAAAAANGDEEAAGTAATAQEVLDGAVDGFVSELTKRLKSDSSLLRNSTVCRVIEVALGNARLKHAQALLHLCLGNLESMFLSPTASFVAETLFASLYYTLSVSLPVEEDGADDGSNPAVSEQQRQVQQLMENACEEVAEAVPQLLLDRAGSRTLKSFCMMLGGLPTRSVPLPPSPVSFPTLLLHLAGTICNAVEEQFCPVADSEEEETLSPKRRVAAAWYTACTTPTSSMVVQGLLACCGSVNPDVDDLVRGRLEKMKVIVDVTPDEKDGSGDASGRSRAEVNAHRHFADDDDDQKAEPRVAKEEEEEVETTATATAKPNEGGKVKKFLLEALMESDIGSFVFQGYLRVRPSAEYIALVDDFLVARRRRRQQEERQKQKRGGAGKGDEKQQQQPRSKKKGGGLTNADDFVRSIGGEPAEKKKDDDGLKEEEADAEASSSMPEDPSTFYTTPWDRCFDLVVEHTDRLLTGASEAAYGRVATIASHLMQDLALYAPTPLQLERLWTVLVKPNLSAMMHSPSVAPCLVKLTRKCAFAGSSLSQPSSSGGQPGMTTSGVEEASRQHVLNDERAGVVYFHTPAELRADICESIVNVCKEHFSPKGAAQALLVDHNGNGGGGCCIGHEAAGYELTSNLLRFGRKAAARVMHSFEKLALQDLIESVAKHPQGTHIMQQFIRNAAVDIEHSNAPSSHHHAPSSTGGAAAAGGGVQQPTTTATSGAGARAKAKGPAQPPAQPKSMLHRLLRRLLPSLRDLATNKYGGFVVQALYEFGPVDVKEALVAPLALLSAAMEKKAAAAAQVPGGGAAVADSSNQQREEAAEGSALFYARKVFLKCNVEQYTHRRDDWRLLAERHSNVKRMLVRILAAEEQL